MKKGLQRICAITIASLMSFSNLVGAVEVSAQELETDVAEYEIYPTPQKTEYTNGSFNVGTDVNIVYESGIDIYTKNKVEEVLESSSINSVISEEIVLGKTNILIGINNSGESVDVYFNENIKHEEAFFEKYDSNLVSVKDGVIGVLGNNTDSSFYGVTTLKHVFNQLENNEIRNFRIDDYADVAYRGFIEGYYGNPWSNEDRAELMKYGGDYKLNQYIFAPKDDPYHNQKWRELYPDEKLAEISALAKVGNETKNRYVYSLHPFMYNAIRFNTDENYEADLNVIKAKFTQLLEADVRQFGILADDASVPPQGPSMYVRLLEDLTTWLVEQQATYPDLKTDLVFCPNDYMGNGSSSQLKEVNKAGDNINIVMTGGRVWGEVSETFTTNFVNNIATEGNPGRAPYMWINWPCSDNSKKHLIMGGNDTFLHPGVNPDNIKGIVLNPMQQAEANKSALFAISDYGWNIWENKEQANQNWEDSFKYMDHGTAEDTESSKALREISRHMINQNMDSRVTALQESVELAPKLNAFKAKYESGASVKEDATALIAEFTKLKEAADYYKNNPGNERIRDQIIYWLKCWEDTMDAAIGYLNAAIAVEDGDNDKTWTEYSKAQTAFEKSKTYGFHYVDHMEYAEVGVQHIVPFIRFMGQNLSNEVGSIVDPSKVITSYITNRTDTQAGSIENVLDNKPATEIVYKSPNTITEGTYVGVKFSTQISLNNIQFLMGTASNLNDTMLDAKLQYTEDGKTWIDLNEDIHHLASDIKVENLELKVKGVRLIATTNKANTWLGVRDIVVNKKEGGDNAELNPSVIRTEGWRVYAGSEANLLDSNDSTDTWYNVGNGDITEVGDYIGLDLGRNAHVGDIHFVVGRDGSADKWTKYKLEYSTDKVNWTTYKEYTGKASGKDIIDENLNGIEARYIRLTNLQELNKWVIFSELSVKEATNIPTANNVYTNIDSGLKSIYSNELTKLVPQENITLNKDEYIGIKLDRIKDLSEIALNVSENAGLQLQTSMNAVEWKNVINEEALEDARYVRLIQLGDIATTFNLINFEVKSNEVESPSLIEAYTSSNTGSEKAFDGDVFSSVKFNAAPKSGDSIVYDLGQTININNIKYLVLDTEKDHIRDGKFQLSLDGETWSDVITIGDGVENPQTDLDSKPQDNGYTHGSLSGGTVPIALSYMEGENLNQEARYLRIVFTAPYNYRWTVINEIMINNGEYIKTVNDPTFTSNPIEMKGFESYKLRDGDLTTSYKPNTNNGEITSGSFTYRLSEKTDVKKINIIQNGNAISNAKVMVRTGYTEDGEEIWNELGTLNKSLNELVNVEFNNIFEIKIEWDGIAPNIYEIITINGYEGPSNSQLKVKYDELVLVAGDIYTISSFEMLQEVLKAADLVLKNNNASQKDIDNALTALIEAEKALVEHASASELQEIIDSCNYLQEDYTVNSWVAYSQLYELAKIAVTNELNMIQEEMDAVKVDLENTIIALVNIATLKLEIEIAEDNLGEESYTPEVWAKYLTLINEAKAIFEKEDASKEEVELAEEKAREAKLALDDQTDTEIIISKPSKLKANEVTSNSITLSWNKAEHTNGLVAYEIYKDGKVLTEVDSETTSFIVEDLKKNTIYGFKVVSKYSNDERSKPASVTARTKK